MKPPPAAPGTTTRVGRYEIVREVGRGRMAVVYLARQTDVDRLVALKELGGLHAAEPLAAQLSHPNIVDVHDCFEHDGTPYIAMEYFERGSLRPYVGKLDLAQIGGVLEGVLAGLVHAEEHGLVHRDLKPENVMVTDDGRVKIADFGITVGTGYLTTYTAPEQAMAHDVGPWTDLYSVGCMASELFRDLQPDVDARISEWTGRLLVKDPTHRTRSARAAWEELEEILLSLRGPGWRRASLLPPTAEHAAPHETGNGASSDEFLTVDWSRRSPVRNPSLAPPPPPPPPPPPVYPRAVVPPPRTVSRWAAPPPAVSPVDEPAPVAVDEAPPVTRRVRTDQRFRRRLMLALSLVAGVCALAVFNALLGGSAGEHAIGEPASPAASPPGILASGQGMSLTMPSGWTQTDSAPDVAGLRHGSVSVEGPEGARVIFGRADRSADNPSLLPANMRESARDGDGAIASIAENVDAYRYDNVPVGAETGTVFAVPTSRGVAMLVCVAGADTCTEIASSWRITAATPLPLGPDTAYTRRLTRTLSTLKQRRAAAASDLHRAGRRPGQVAATARLAGAYAATAKALRALTMSPADAGANRELAAALDAISRAYGKASREASRKDAAGFRREGRNAVSAHRDLTATLAALKQSGHDLSASTDLKAVTLPALKRDPAPMIRTPARTPVATPTHARGGGGRGGGGRSMGGGGSAGGGSASAG